MTALITGGSSGIGLEFARQLSRMGYDLVLVSNRPQELSEVSRSLIEEYGVSVLPAELDLAQEGCARKLLDLCDSNGLQVDVLINNAGVYFMEYLGEGSLEKARTMLGLHVETITELCILFGSRMKERRNGYILIMSSMTARIPAPGIATYSASKAYLKSFGKGFSYEMRPFGVMVTTVCPAAVDTGLYRLSPGVRSTGRRLGLIQSPESLARRALMALFKGRRVLNPGLMNALLPPLIALLPARLIDRLGMRWIYEE